MKNIKHVIKIQKGYLSKSKVQNSEFSSTDVINGIFPTHFQRNQSYVVTCSIPLAGKKSDQRNTFSLDSFCKNLHNPQDIESTLCPHPRIGAS